MTDPSAIDAFIASLLEKSAAEPGEALPTGPVTIQNLFRHPEADPVVLDIVLLRKYGPEFLDWEGETLEYILPKDFKSEISELNLQKVQAMKALHLVDTFWQRWEVFGWLTMALNALFPNWEVLQAPTVAQCLVSIDIAKRVREDVEWSEEIKAYLEVVYRHDGILLALPPADFIEVNTSGLPVNVQSLKERWPAVRASGKAPSGDDVEEEQLRRLLIAHQFLEESRARRRTQLLLLDQV